MAYAQSVAVPLMRRWMAQIVGVTSKGFFLLPCFLLVSSAAFWFFRFSSASLFHKLQSLGGCPCSSKGHPHGTVPQSSPPPRVCLQPLAVAGFFRYVRAEVPHSTPNQNNPLENSLSCVIQHPLDTFAVLEGWRISSLMHHLLLNLSCVKFFD